MAQPQYGQQPVPGAQPDPSFQAGSAAVPAPPGYGPGGYPGGPVPPTYDPAMMAQQYSAPPVSGPYGAGPVSGPYGYGVPMMSAIPGPPQKSGRVGTIILSVLTALFLVATGVLGTLFVLKNKEADKLSSQVTQLNGDLDTNRAKLAAMQKDLDSTKRDLSDSQGQTAEITTQKKAIADCINALYDYLSAASAAGSTTSAAVKAKEADANAKCDAAQKYL